MGDGGVGAAGGPGATCPSGRCQPGSTLFGIVGPDGVLGYMTPPLPVDADFVAIARTGRPPESRFRFAEPCAGDGCAQWGGGQCGLVDQLVASPARPPVAEGLQVLPRCGIRRSCRWFAQRGADACGVCPVVVHTARVPASG